MHVDYGEPKSTLWARHGQVWTAESGEDVGRVGAVHPALPLPIGHRVRGHRGRDTGRARPIPARRHPGGLVLPAQTRITARLVHATLFRYRSTLADPGGLLAAVDATSIDVRTAVDQLTVSEELVSPSPVTSTRAALASRDRASWLTNSRLRDVTRPHWEVGRLS